MPPLNTEAPDFSLDGVVAGEVRRFDLRRYRGHWVILFFYPADFTFVCPTEILGFQKRMKEFKERDTEILAISVDDVTSHRAWAEELGGLAFPLLSDVSRETSRTYGVLSEGEGRAFRATVIVAPEGTIAYMVVSPMNVGRSVEETVRVLDALQTGRLCPADWKPGDATFGSALKY